LPFMKNTYELILKLKHFCHCNERKISTYCHINLAELKGIKAMGRDEAITCSDFSKRINLSPSRSSRIIDNMVKKKLLLRKAREDDRRSMLLYLTKKGWELKENIAQEEKKFEQFLATQLSDADIEIIKKGLKLLEKVMKNDIYDR
jgi:DNA-binding MarR family transcriptional regulator